MATTPKPYNMTRLITLLTNMRNAGGGTLTVNQLGRILALLQQQTMPPAGGNGTPSPVGVPTPAVPGTGSNIIPPTVIPPTDTGGGGNSFLKYFYPVTDILGVGASIGGRIANAYYKTKAAKQVARGNAPQHLAASLSTPGSQAVYGNPLGDLAKISSDAGQAAAATSLAKGEAWQGSLQDVSNFISSINTMRRLFDSNSLTAMGLIAMQRMATQQRGP
jgi:hypothetical protein